MQALSIAASGMIAQQHRTEVVSNNLANMNTTGYQRQRTEFNNLLYRNHLRPASKSSQPGETVPSGVQSGHGVKIGAVYRVNEQGALKSTTNTFDVAIQGEGYFQVQLPNGDTAYTRDGTFQLNEAGQLVTHEGLTVLPGINIPAGVTDITINSSGEVLVTQGDGGTANVGGLLLSMFPNPGGLYAIGDNMFVATDKAGEPAVSIPGANGVGTVLQGFIESSNVNAIDEISALIRANRAYQMNAKVMQAADEMMATRR